MTLPSSWYRGEGDPRQAGGYVTMTSFADRVVLITGAGSGIGRQMARTLAAQGARVAAIDRAPDGLAGLADDLRTAGIPAARFASAVADVTDWPSLRDAAAWPGQT